MKTSYKIYLSLFLLVIALLGWAQYVFFQNHYNNDQAMERALTAFVAAKTLNGLISVIQGTEVAATPAGLGLNFAVGEIVDPMNDLIERFSWVMLASIASLGIQKILLYFGETQTFQILISLLVGFTLILIWRDSPYLYKVRQFLLKLILITYILKMFIPMIIFIDSQMYTHIFAPQYEEATHKLSMTGKALEQSSDISGGPDTEKMTNPTLVDEVLGWFDKQINTVQNTLDPTLIKKRLEKLEILLDEATQHVIILLAQFIFSSILFPVFALWVLYKTISGILKLRV